MPLYTYVLSWKGRTATRQLRTSNHTGWMAQVIGEAFPDIPRTERLYLRPLPIPNLSRAWLASGSVAGGDMLVHIIETRD